MDNRLSNILKLIAQQNQLFKIDDLANEFQVSSRTIYSDLAKLNEVLSSTSNEIRIEKGEIYLNLDSELEIEDLLVNDDNFISSNKKLRKIRLIELIFLAPEFFSTNLLLERLFVSRNTLIGDLKEIKEEFHKQKIDIESVPFKGYKIVGHERKIRSLFVATLLKDPLIFETADFHEEKYLLKKIQSFLEDFCEELNVDLSDDSFEQVSLFFWVTKKRLDISKELSFELTGKAFSQEEDFLIRKKRNLEKLFKRELPEKELIYLANKLSEASLTKNEELLSENWLSYNLLVEKLIKSVERDYSIRKFTDDQKLFEGLLNHLRPAYKRALSSECIDNPLFEYVTTNYSELTKVVKENICVIEKPLNIKFTEQELSFFTLFFAASIEKNKIKIPSSISIIVVCNAGISTSEILKSKMIANYNVDILGTFGVREGKKWLLENTVDLVLTTVPLKVKNVPVIQVNPYLSEKDMEAISRFIEPAVREISVENLMSIVKKQVNMDYRTENKLSIAFSSYLGLQQKRNIQMKGYQPMLKEIISEELIEAHFVATNRDDAVRKSGDLLVNKGLAKPSYVDGMIENVEVNGTYIVIAPGIAMPHARPEKGALGVGFSLLTLEHPIVFGHPKNDPVSIVVGLCAVDHQTHLKALAEIVGILSDEKNVNAIKEAKNSKEILNILLGGN